MIKQCLLIVICSLTVATASARGVYQKPEDFIKQTFTGKPPQVQRLWITDAMQAPIRQIMGHKLDRLRLRYWRQQKQTVWILEEIGKDKPITVGIVVKDNKIVLVKVLVFRESRGWEVRYPFFSDQFKQAALTTKLQLDRNIDGITGATLSVRALKKLARLALYLHQQVVKSNVTP